MSRGLRIHRRQLNELLESEGGPVFELVEAIAKVATEKARENVRKILKDSPAFDDVRDNIHYKINPDKSITIGIEQTGFALEDYLAGKERREGSWLKKALAETMAEAPTMLDLV